MAGDDGATFAGGQGIAESGGLGADRHDRRKGVPAARASIGANLRRFGDNDGVFGNQPERNWPLGRFRKNE